jgi:hypothetical protein
VVVLDCIQRSKSLQRVVNVIWLYFESFLVDCFIGFDCLRVVLPLMYYSKSFHFVNKSLCFTIDLHVMSILCGLDIFALLHNLLLQMLWLKLLYNCAMGSKLVTFTYRNKQEVPKELQWEVNRLFARVTRLGLQSYKSFINNNNL